MKARAALWLALAGACSPASEEMARQGRFEEYEPADFFGDGGSARHLPRGVVARVALHDASAPRLEGDVEREEAAGDVVDRELLARGRERYGIWCSPCHAWTGRGGGAVVQRGFPAPPPFTEERLRDAPDAHLHEVLENGLGKMPPYGPHVPPADRRAIVAWIRVLQRSQHAVLADAPPEERERLIARRAEGPR